MKPPSPVRLGMPADEVLKLRGRSEAESTTLPRVIGQDEEGHVVEWYYPDIIVEMRRRNGQYRVAKVTGR